jgi:UDPglucose 6-dehydrogenase
MIKYTANAILATKVSFMNEVADLCEVVGADVKDVATGIGLYHRIGASFLRPGPAWGGSCVPKDTRAFLTAPLEKGGPAAVVDRIRKACGGALAGKKIGVLVLLSQ